MERDCIAALFKSVKDISTHTLTWSVTENFFLCNKFEWISTHTLTWSVTQQLYPLKPLQEISTHTLTWSVTQKLRNSVISIHISTHTLTWSVTNRIMLNVLNVWFQLTRSRGAWPFLLTCLFSVTLFQLTRSRGAWHAKVGNHLACYHFNSHAHVERDHGRTYQVPLMSISTHTLTWSVTIADKFLDCIQIFQLTRSRGAWRLFCRLHKPANAFQLTRSRGAWRLLDDW